MTEMNDRLGLFMRSEQLTAAKLAEIVQVQPSSISHLLSGRNKPNFEFVSRLMRMFPELSPDWLINGIGAMYRHQNEQQPHKEPEDRETPSLAPNLFEQQQEKSVNQSVPSSAPFDTTVTVKNEFSDPTGGFGGVTEGPMAESEATTVAASTEPVLPAPKPIGAIAAAQGAPSGVRQVVVLFDDQTCLVYQTRPTT